jgi:hypothetical protein
MSKLPPLGGAGGKGLGNLAQSARQKHIKSAQRVLLVIGILTVAANGFMMATAKSQVDQLIQQNPQFANQADAIMNMTYLLGGGAMAVGVAFIVLSFLVPKFPVPSTIIGLVLYVGSVGVFAALEPLSLVQGWLFKIIIVVSLVKSIQAAIAYQRESKLAEGFKPSSVGLGAEL